MTCQRMKDLIHGYIDGELSLTEQLSFEEHLSTCPDCERAHQSFSQLRETLRRDDLRYALPSTLKLKLPQVDANESAPAWRISPLRYLATAAMILLAFGLGTLWHSRTQVASISQDLVDAHVRSLQADHLFDVASTDQHTVKPWFDGKLDFAPPVRDLAADGFPLVGGRLDYLQNHAAAALVYGRHKHQINLFIWPEPGADESIAESSVNGYQVMSWRSAGMKFAAVSDLNAEELHQFAELLRR
jgi:anti-sigma factor RsiW